MNQFDRSVQKKMRDYVKQEGRLMSPEEIRQTNEFLSKVKGKRATKHTKEMAEKLGSDFLESESEKQFIDWYANLPLWRLSQYEEMGNGKVVIEDFIKENPKNKLSSHKIEKLITSEFKGIFDDPIGEVELGEDGEVIERHPTKAQIHVTPKIPTVAQARNMSFNDLDKAFKEAGIDPAQPIE